MRHYVKVLGEAFSPEDEEDCAVKEVTALWVYQARYRIPVEEAAAGNWVLIEGVDGSISKTATLVPVNGAGGFQGFKVRRCRLTSA